MIILALGLLIFIDTMSIGIVTPVFGPLFLEGNQPVFTHNAEFSLRGLFYTLILSAPLFFMLFGSPLLGELSDRYGRKKILIAGLIGVAVSFVLAIYGVVMSSLLLLFISRAVAGVMDGSQAVAQAAIADITPPAERAKNLSFISLAATLGFVVGPLLGGFFSNAKLVPWFDYKTPFIVALVLTLLNAVILQIVFKETYVPTQKQPNSFGILFKNIFTAAIDRRVRLLSFAFFCLQFCWGGYFQAVSLLLAEQYHYSSAKLGYFMAYLAGVFVLSLIILIKIFLRYFKHEQLMVIGLLLMALSSIGVSLYIDNIYLIWLSVLPMAIGVALAYNILLSLFSQAVNENEQGWIMGGTTALVAIGWLLASIAIALLIGRHVFYLFALFAAMVAASAAVCVVSKRRAVVEFETVYSAKE